jgi:hypothetical protein
MTCRVEGPLPLSSVALCREALTKHQRSGCRTSISPPSAGYGRGALPRDHVEARRLTVPPAPPRTQTWLQRRSRHLLHSALKWIRCRPEPQGLSAAPEKGRQKSLKRKAMARSSAAVQERSGAVNVGGGRPKLRPPLRMRPCGVGVSLSTSCASSAVEALEQLVAGC